MRFSLAVFACAAAGCAYPDFVFTRDDTAIEADDASAADSSIEMDSTVEPDTATPIDSATNDTIRVVADTSVVDTAPKNTAGTLMTIASRGATWRYLDDGTTPASTAWRGASYFDDSKWKSGAAQLGFGDGDEKTVITAGSYPDAGVDADAADVLDAPDTFIPYTSYYFRRQLTVTGASSFDRLTIKLLRDDGAIVYLNGTEIVRSNMPSGTVSGSTFASATVTGGDEDTFFEFNIAPTALREGNNVIAVEVHQSNGGSTDISFDLEIVGHKP